MDYELFIDGKKTELPIKTLHITDKHGAEADEIKITMLTNTDASISKGQRIACNFGGFRSGNMNIDLVHCVSTTAKIGAISAPIDAKAKRTRHWLKVRLFDIVNDVAVNCGISVFYKGVENIYYENVTQFRETDLSFLNRLCIREGYTLKVDDCRIIIYDTAELEAEKTVKTIGFNDVIDNRIAFAENPNAVKSVTVKHFKDRLISYTADNLTQGEEITINEYVNDEAEAERFAKAYLKHFTRNEITVDALIPITDGIASGNCIEIVDYAKYNGKYFICECCHDPLNNQTRLIGRKIR